jgi:hypothetical protein
LVHKAFIVATMAQRKSLGTLELSVETDTITLIDDLDYEDQVTTFRFS